MGRQVHCYTRAGNFFTNTSPQKSLLTLSPTTQLALMLGNAAQWRCNLLPLRALQHCCEKRHAGHSKSAWPLSAAKLAVAQCHAAHQLIGG